MSKEDLCLADSVTTHRQYLQKTFFQIDNVGNKSQYNIRFCKLDEGFGKASLILPRGTKFTINKSLFSSK